MRGVGHSDAIESVTFRHEEGNEGEKIGVKRGNEGLFGVKLLKRQGQLSALSGQAVSFWRLAPVSPASIKWLTLPSPKKETPAQMQTLGIIGGIAPESTVEYYRLIIASYRRQTADGSYPPLLINSIDLTKLLGLVAAARLPEVTEYLLAELQKLARAGADLALLASNTPHIVFDDLERQSPIPLISIVECACQQAKSLGLKKVGLFGTRFTMQAKFYPAVFAREGIAVVTPDPADQDYIHTKYMDELINATFLPETRAGLLAIVERLKKQADIQGVLLGGTELPLILRDNGGTGIPFLDTSRIHAESAVARILE
jgi:aspartate racemase